MEIGYIIVLVTFVMYCIINILILIRKKSIAQKLKFIVDSTLARFSETSEIPTLTRYGEIRETHIEMATNGTSNSSQNLPHSSDSTYPSTANFNHEPRLQNYSGEFSFFSYSQYSKSC